MKKLALLSCLLITIVLTGGWLYSQNRPQKSQIPDLIRFHVRANSDSEVDQALKLRVRDAILAKFSPVLAQAASLDASRELVEANLPAMEQEANRVISSEGKEYSARAVYGYANFPVKSYGNFTLPAGRYEAVQILIGEGKGANWWCVLFPPLCFVDVTTSLAHEPVVSTNIKSAEPSISAPVAKETNQGETAKADTDEEKEFRHQVETTKADIDAEIEYINQETVKPKVKIKAIEVVRNLLNF